MQQTIKTLKNQEAKEQKSATKLPPAAAEAQKKINKLAEQIRGHEAEAASLDLTQVRALLLLLLLLLWAIATAYCCNNSGGSEWGACRSSYLPVFIHPSKCFGTSLALQQAPTTVPLL